jgi:hypothetical protein
MNKKVFALNSISATALALAAGSASAHVGYGTSLYNQATNTYAAAGTSGMDPTVSSNAGWISGMSNNGFNRTASVDTLADTHNNRFRFFTLTQQSQVSFTITGTNTNGNGLLNPGYSLFSGQVPASSHDGVGDTNGLTAAQITAMQTPAHNAYLAGQPAFATWSPFYDAMDEITANGGGTVDAGGANWGVYRADGNVTMGNNSGLVSTMTYLGISGGDGHGSDVLDNSISWAGLLGPGVYSLVIGGSSLTDLASLFALVQQGVPACTDANNPATCNGTVYPADYTTLRLARTAHIDFNVQAVPVPAAVWLLGSALAGMGIIGRRRETAVAA